MRDTSPAAADVQAGIYRRMSPEHKCELAARMSVEARVVTMAGIQRRHPEYDADHVRLALFRILLGDETFRRVWPQSAPIAP